MRTFINSILLFLFGWLLLSAIVDFLLTKKIKSSPARDIVVWEDIFNAHIDADIIFLGSSRTCDHYNPMVIDSITGLRSYNLGLHAKNGDMDVLRYHLLKKYGNKQPRLIVWDVFHNTMTYSNTVCDYKLTPYVYDTDVWDALHNQRHGFKTIDRIIPLLRYWKHSEIIDYAYKPVHSDEKNPKQGFVGKDIPWFPHKTLRDMMGGGIECSYDTNIVKMVRSTIREMQNDGSTVILTYSPFYIEGQSKIKDLPIVVDSLQSLAASEHCLFLSFLNDRICFDSTLFANALHINRTGAIRFSRIFAYTIDTLVLTNNNKQ